ncbi:MAG: hypothetical protein M9952_01070 [Microthrixaceae bacterium]|nr:hypothetical protein [Microthrixaceae bacterium]
MPLRQVVLRIDERDASGLCVVRCPSCSARITQHACDAMMTALVAVGIEISLAVGDVGEPDPGVPLTETEVNEFADRLKIADDVLGLVGRNDPPTTSVH